jgi:ornithine carbamoyltransferase
MKHFATLLDYSTEEIEALLQLATEVKASPGQYRTALAGKTMALLFQKTSTRTRASFEIGMYQLGGYSMYMDWRTTNFTLGSLQDEIRCLSRYVDCIMARVYEHSDIELMTAAATVPVINGLSDLYHPCQALADMMVMREKAGATQGFSVTFVGDGSNNVARSLAVICCKLGIQVNITCPQEFQPAPDFLQLLQQQGIAEHLTVHTNPEEGIAGADFIYTDTFVSMGQENESKRRLPIFKPYQVNRELLSTATKHPYIMHCLPVHRDIEISSEVYDSPQSIVYDQAEDRLHAQKALLLTLLADRG